MRTTFPYGSPSRVRPTIAQLRAARERQARRARRGDVIETVATYTACIAAVAAVAIAGYVVASHYLATSCAL